MTAAYAYTAEIWPPLLAAVFLAAIGFYSWRRRDVPGAVWLAAGTLVGILWLLGIALEAAAAGMGNIQIAWHVYQAIWMLPAVTSATCFALEYAYPGRWLTRRNLALLWVPSLLLAIVCVVAPGLVWQSFWVRPDASIGATLTPFGRVLLIYGMGLILINTAAFAWLFVRSPQHRWPVVLILCGQLTGRVLYLQGMADLRVPAFLDATVASIVLVWLVQAVALFGFRILDPVPAARTAALDQMHDAMMVFDMKWRVAGLNRAAASLVAMPWSRARGKTLTELLPGHPDLAARLGAAVDASDPTEITLGAGSQARYYELDVSPLEDFRQMRIGRLLMLRDVTESRRAQARILEQQRALAVLEERERLARELHDGVAQGLAAVYMQANAAKALLDRGDTEEVAACLDGLSEMTLETQANVREYLLAAKTMISETASFFPALRDYLLRFSRYYSLPVQLTVPPDLEARGLSQAVEVQLLRIIQEALSNVRKHACARSVQITFSVEGQSFRVAVADNGCGFDAADAGRGDGYGLRAMRERAEAVGGSLKVVSACGQGTRVEVVASLGG